MADDVTVVLQELSYIHFRRVEAIDDGMENAGGAVDDVEPRMEALFENLARGEHGGIVVGEGWLPQY